jgi:N6-L-threonylcarbamoyladenine synthase
MSGGHCLLTLIKGAEDFVLLGQSVNSSSPGEATDKIARHLRLWDIPELASTSGGQAVEILASRAPPGGHLRYPPTRISRINHRDCDFDFHHFKAYYLRYIDRNGRPSDSALEMFCASFQHNIFKHMALRLQRCIEILDEKEMVPIGGRILVLSGGVARNSFYRKGLAFVAAQYDYRLVCPPPVLCSDNGVMIAWTGVELLEKRSNVIINRSNLPHALYVDDRLPIGDDVRDDFKEMHWKVQTKIDLDDIDAFMLSGDLDDESAKRVQM